MVGHHGPSRGGDVGQPAIAGSAGRSCFFAEISTAAMTSATVRNTAAQTNATWYPCTNAALGASPGLSARWPATDEAEKVLRSASPSEPPTCWEVLSTAEAMPASCSATPTSAVLDAGTKTAAMPKLIASSAGSTSVT